jgi:ectoine hydroxylase-related dioxygenase (phytanoyl-CoA dioxygenase family)
MLTPEERNEFQELGLTRLPGGVDPRVAGEMRERVWAFLAECCGIEREAPDTWKRVTPSIFRPLQKAGAFDAMCSASVCGAVDELLGGRAWSVPKHPGQVLMTFPVRGPWTVPQKIWHLDYAAPGWLDGLPGIQIFLLLDRVESRGGGTLAVAGSHQLVQRLREKAGPGYEGRSSEVRKALRRAVPWLRDLWSADQGEDRVQRFMGATTRFEDVPLRVVEMTGDPGDVILMHPWLLHAPALNCRRRARMMLTERARIPSGPC